MSLERAEFIARDRCFGCGGADFDVVATGRFDQGNLAQFLAADPWGESPLPYLAGAVWTLVRCRTCSLKFHRDVLSPQWNERRFSKWMSGDAIKAFEASARGFDAFDRASGFAEHVLRIENLLRASHGIGQRRKILDFGCGNGEFLEVCAAFGFEAHGVDRSSARRREAGHCRVHEEIADAAEHGPFDAITLFEVLEHLDDPAAVLVTLRGILRENGLLILETPNCRGVDQIESMADYRAVHPLDHINAFEPDTLQAFAERLGFRRVPRKAVFVTADRRKAVRRIAKSWLEPLAKTETQLYFRKA